VTPALAIGEVLREAGDATLFVGTDRGLERRLVPAAGFELALLPSRPLVGRSAVDRLRGVVALLTCTLRALRLLGRFGAELVIAVGGYASVAPALAAVLRGIPVVLVNTDATPGAANRLVGRFARRLFVGFPAAATTVGRGAGDPRVQVTGVPLRRALREAFADGEAPGPDPKGRVHLFAFGGSQGARQINDALLGAIPQLDPARVAVVHQTGEADRERVARAWAEAGFEAEVVAFEPDMPARYRQADLVVCRAGAISIAELALAGRAALLVPLAHVGGGEQFANARVLEEVGAARVLDSRHLDPETFERTLRELLADPEALRTMGQRAATLARPEAAETIVAACRAVVAGADAAGPPAAGGAR
jgi:UDP-N-acetylglucosamine--N-acetylmuramyl-(pentapeptide) pyrophosphoryl-undecaprenol N-acetylglucosamine transferase